MSDHGSFCRREFLKTMAVGTAAGWLTPGVFAAPEAAPPNAPDPRPNIIFILADDLAWGDLGCYGCPDTKTPNIDRLAADGVRFTDAYSASAVCSPTRVAFLTGRYQQRAGYMCEDYMGSGCPAITPEKEPTVAMFLKAAGYGTACYGKWNVSGADATLTPNDHGFDHWVGFQHNFNYFTHRSYDFKAADWVGPVALYEDHEIKDRPGYIDNILADCTIDYIGRQARSGRPFFVYVPFQAPHSPMQAPDADPLARVPKDTKTEQRPIYIKIVENLDRQVGRIMEALKQNGIDGKTLVVFTSDNGGHQAGRNAPLKGMKLTLYEGGIRVPFIMRWPGVIPPGQTTPQPAITMDVTATILAQAKAAPPPGRALDGVDLMPYVTGRCQPDRDRTLCFRLLQVNMNTRKAKLFAKAIRDGDWKYVIDYLRKTEGLYNLHDDMVESKNLLESRPEIADRLKARLAAWEAEVTPPNQDVALQ
ncbi:MAG: sulfatase-like hydrolase/transferase [bacterium]|nr:sulfatase-like hydrolase/transferase [bacterium]